MSQPKSEKKKMVTSREAYDRIIWDARLDSKAFAIGYLDRSDFGGIREKPLLEWDTDGDIPWHRIRYIRCREVIIWDRDKHVDLLSTGQLPAAAWVTQSEVGAAIPPADNQNITSAFSARPVYNYSSQGWQPINQPSESVPLSALKIVSFNVLSDKYEQEHIHTEQRIPAIIEYLRDSDADIVALQEVTRSLLEALLVQDWVRESFICEPPDSSTIERYGLLLLSRLPFTLVEHRYSAHKQVLVGTWLLNEQFLRVAVVHLTSNRSRNPVATRARQLNLLLDYLKTQPGDWAIAGDFNIADNEHLEELTRNGFIDVWKVLHPLEQGYTFDPRHNTLAALTSMSGKAARFDRILLRSQNGSWLPRAMELFACEPLSGSEGKLYASDHFGVSAVLESSLQTTVSLGAVRSNPFGDIPSSPHQSQPTTDDRSPLDTVRPAYQSAIVVIPPPEVWPAIQAIRHRHDSKIGRWMPHITLVYGFVPEEYFEEAVQVIAPALAQVKPFEVTLTGFETFAHRKSATAWLQPETQPARALHELQAVLQQLFPQCDEQSQKSGAGFTPHLSVGQFTSAKEALAQLPLWHPVSFPVESVALISRRNNEPFEVRYTVRLGMETPESTLMQLLDNLEPQLSQAQRSHRETVLGVVAQACAECLGEQRSLHLLGSARLGVESPQSDLDILCLVSAYQSGEAFLESVRQKLEGLCDRALLVKDARVPVLRMRLEGVSVDLLYARSLSCLGTLEHLAEAVRQNSDPVSWLAFAGCLEADMLADKVCQRIPFESFRHLLRAVRAWAKARQIHGNAWGFLGSFSWALLAAWSCESYPQDAADTRLPSLLAHFFTALTQHDWSQPIALTEAGRQYQVRERRDWLPVITSIEPCQNSARNVSRSTAQILRREFVRAAALATRVKAGEIGWEALFEQAELQAESELFLILTAKSQNNQDLETCRSWLEGRIIGLVIDLEHKLDAFVRPWPGMRKEQNTWSAVLGLQLPNGCDRTTLQQMGQEFVRTYPHGSNWESVLCDRQALAQLGYIIRR